MSDMNTVIGHAGRLLFATMGTAQVPVILLIGRAQSVRPIVPPIAIDSQSSHTSASHLSNISNSSPSFYEGHTMETVTYATRVCRIFGVQVMLLTNAAGGLNPDYNVGDIVLLNDHLNLAGLVGFHPLRGPNADDFGTRFPPLSDGYDISLRQLAHKAWREQRQEMPSQRRMHEGVYAFVGGPSYETRAECRMLRQFGADVVGMSTVPEIIVARHSGMRVMAFSLVTNNAVLEPTVRADEPELQGLSREELDKYLSRGKADHQEVLEAGQAAALDMQGLVLKIVSEL
jgi:purine-nucleoside phosphorylase